MTEMKDYRGVNTTVSSREAMDKFEQALKQLQAYHGDPVETVDEAIELDPNFVMAHCLRAHCGSAMADGEFSEHLQESLESAEKLTKFANDRERKHMAALKAWLDGEFKQSVDILESILIDYPRDVLALQIAHLSDFYLGDSHNLRDRVARVLPQYDKDTPGYGYALGMYAFGLEECNEYARAEQFGKQALEISAGDVWALHAVAHVLEMQGRQAEGIDWYESRIDDWVPDNGFAVHNWWHLALYYMDIQKYDKVFQIYDDSIAGGTVALENLDASALLWRLYLLDIDVGDRWRTLADKWASNIEHGGYYCFNDCHAIMAFVADARFKLAEEMMRKLEASTQGDNYSSWMTRTVGLPVAQAIIAYSQERYAEAAKKLASVRYTANRFGGSHAQRDLISQTLIESAIRSGQLNYARALLAERVGNKGTSPRTWQNTARVLDALQCHEESENASKRAAELLG